MAQEKLYGYEGGAFVGRFRSFWRDIKEKWSVWKEEKIGERRNFESEEDYSHIYRSKTRKELIRLSAAVMGIEFSYAAETAFVSPTLLKIGVEHKHMTLVWALSPLIGFFLTPILGSLSDRCNLDVGRRRPFIFIMSLGVLLGLILVPNGESLGYLFGDSLPGNETNRLSAHRITIFRQNTSTFGDFYVENSPESVKGDNEGNSRSWGIFFTILGTVLLDFDADACQSPARAYLLDVTTPDDHARGLSTFTIMAGLGGFLGYALGGINWDGTLVGTLLGGHVRAVFSLTTVIFIICVSYTITSFKEMPLYILENRTKSSKGGTSYSTLENDTGCGEKNYGTVEATQQCYTECPKTTDDVEMDVLAMDPAATSETVNVTGDISLLVYLKSIIHMPYSIRMVCLTNLFCWMAHVCYSLYFTDFVGEAVFLGSPVGSEESPERELYESGVRFGCWGMSMYSLSCACYSMVIEKFIKRCGARFVYVAGLLIYSTGMLLMAACKNRFGVILFSWTAGVMYSTLFTMPYLLVAHYHSKGIFHAEQQRENEEIYQESAKKQEIMRNPQQIRGLGTDIAIVSSMVFLAQFILSLVMGSIVNLTGTTTSVVCVASTLALFGAISATRIVYLDL